jgi:hypothetical protein
VRKLLAALAGPAVIAVLAAPSAAVAAQNNDVGFSVGSTAGYDVSFPTNWTREPNLVVRTKTDYGSINLFVNDNVDGGLCVRLLAARDGSQLGSTRCWPAGTYYAQTMATNVLATTRFTVWATKWHSSSTNNYWGGYHTALNPWRGGYLYY